MHRGLENGGGDEAEVQDQEEPSEFVKEETGGEGQKEAEGDGKGHGHGAFDGGGGLLDDVRA